MQTVFPLPRWFPREPYESPPGCLLRLAECNGLPGTSVVRLMTGLAVHRIKTGKDLEDLAAVLHCDIKKLRRNATFEKGKSLAAVGGQVLRPRTDFADFTAGFRRACPACLAEAPYHRVWWDWTFVSSCPFHDCMLAKNCSCGSTLTWEDGSPFRCRLCDDGDVRGLALELADPKVLAFDRWVVDRFLHPNQTPVHFIDAIPLGYAAEIVKRIGALSLGGYQSRFTGLSKLGEPHIIRAHGFDNVVTGTMDAVLDRAFEGYITATQDASPCLRRMYGWFYPWFQFIGGRHLSPGLAELIFQNASKKIQVTRRAFSCLLRTGTGPLTLSEAARTAKVRHSTMRRLLAAEGLIREQKRRGIPVLVSSAIAERIAVDMRQSLTIVTLGGVLALSRTAITKLVRAGLVPTWLPGGANRGAVICSEGRTFCVGWRPSLARLQRSK
jgi:hypothetical protein